MEKTELDGVEFLKPGKKLTCNAVLIRKAFITGFKSGIAFLNEADFISDTIWQKRSFKQFCKKHNIKVR